MFSVDTRGLALPPALRVGVEKLFRRSLGAPVLLDRLYGSTVSYGHLARTDRASIRAAATGAPADADIQDLADLLQRIGPETPVCDRCGELPLSSTGGRIAELEAGAACPFCQQGHFELVPQKLRAISWASGALVEPEVSEDLRARPGVRIPLDDRGLRDWAGFINARLETACAQEELSLGAFLAYMNLRRRALSKLEEATSLLQEPAHFGLAADDELSRAIIEAKVFVAEREVTNLPHTPLLPDGRRRDSLPAVRIGTRRYLVEGRIAAGDKCDVYRARWDARTTELVILKVLRDERDLDRLEREATMLRRLEKSEAQGSELFSTLVPELVQEGMLVTRQGVERRALVLRDKNQFDWTLDDVMREYPEGIGTETMVWMYNRVLPLLDWIHRSHLVHGAVAAPHLLIHARNHGVILLDFSTADRESGKLTKQNDVAMAARAMISVLGNDPKVPLEVSELLRAHAADPPSAADAYRVFCERMSALFGARRYHPFHMPKRSI